MKSKTYSYECKRPNQAVSILGETWLVIYSSADADPRLEDNDGFCDPSARVIVIDRRITGSIENLAKLQRKVIRHEVIHAFLAESGLDNCTHSPVAWARDEEMVDWLANMWPKINTVLKELGVEK